jgi:hypothetical protein
VSKLAGYPLDREWAAKRVGEPAGEQVGAPAGERVVALEDFPVAQVLAPVAAPAAVLVGEPVAAALAGERFESPQVAELVAGPVAESVAELVVALVEEPVEQ